MLNWIRDLVRRWLLNINPRDVRLRDGSRVRAVRQVGLHLVCKDRDGFEALVDANRAADRGEFWWVWRRMKSRATAVWTDGTPFDPDEM